MQQPWLQSEREQGDKTAEGLPLDNDVLLQTRVPSTGDTTYTRQHLGSCNTDDEYDG